MPCMIFLPYFREHMDFIEGNEEFKFVGKGLEKLKNFKKISQFMIKS